MPNAQEARGLVKHRQALRLVRAESGGSGVPQTARGRSEIGDRPVLGHKDLHDAPRGEVIQRADREHDEVGVLRLILVRVGQCARELQDDHPAETSGHRADAGDGTDRLLGEHVGDGGEEVGRPCLMGRRADADDGDSEGRGMPSEVAHIRKILGGEHREGEQRDEEHRRHAGLIGRHAALHQGHRDAAAVDTADDRDAVDDECGEHDLVLGHAELLLEVIGQPEEVEPPDAVGHEFPEEEGPGLRIAEQAGLGGGAVGVRGLGSRTPGKKEEGGYRAEAGQEIDQDEPARFAEVVPAAGLGGKAHPEGDRADAPVEGECPAAAQGRKHRRDEIKEQAEEDRHAGDADKGGFRHPSGEGEEGAGDFLARLVLVKLLLPGLVMVAVDVVELFLREALLPGGRRVEPEPEDQPRKAGRTGDDEGHLPA